MAKKRFFMIFVPFLVFKTGQGPGFRTMRSSQVGAGENLAGTGWTVCSAIPIRPSILLLCALA
jgi:hypothetical protein